MIMRAQTSGLHRRPTRRHDPRWRCSRPATSGPTRSNQPRTAAARRPTGLSLKEMCPQQPGSTGFIVKPPHGAETLYERNHHQGPCHSVSHRARQDRQRPLEQRQCRPRPMRGYSIGRVHGASRLPAHLASPRIRSRLSGIGRSWTVLNPPFDSIVDESSIPVSGRQRRRTGNQSNSPDQLVRLLRRLTERRSHG